MKALNDFIIESIGWTLTDSERDQLIEIIGFATGNLGEDEDINKYKDFEKDCYENEFATLEDVYDVLNDKYTYKKITNRNLDKNEVFIINKLIQYALDNDLVDLSEIQEKIA